MTHNLTEALTTFPDTEGLVFQRCDIESVIPRICSGTVDDFCERVRPSKDAGYMTCNIAGSELVCRKHVFIVNLFSV